MRILCLDVGDRKIGLSLSDPTLSIAQGLKVYRRGSAKEDLRELRQIVEEHGVERIVVGLPKNLDGRIGKRAQGVIEFAEEIVQHQRSGQGLRNGACNPQKEKTLHRHYGISVNTSRIS
jgi:putative Holliday junction resolvase